MKLTIKNVWNTKQPKSYYDSIVKWFCKINDLDYLDAYGLIVNHKGLSAIMYDNEYVNDEPIETAHRMSHCLGEIRFNMENVDALCKSSKYDGFNNLLDFHIDSVTSYDNLKRILALRLSEIEHLGLAVSEVALDDSRSFTEESDRSMLITLLRDVSRSSDNVVKSHRRQLESYIKKSFNNVEPKSNKTYGQQYN